MVALGRKRLADIRTSGNNKFLIGAGAPDDPETRKLSRAPTFDTIDRLFSNYPNLTNDGFLSNLVQTWQDFLGDLFEGMARSTLSGGGRYNLGGFSRGSLNIGNLDPANLVASLVDASKRNFDFETPKSKLQIVSKALAYTPSTGDEATIRKFIMARNVIQHNSGVLRAEHLAEVGIAEFESDDPPRVTRYREGDRLQVTLYDLENFTSAATSVANGLVP